MAKKSKSGGVEQEMIRVVMSNLGKRSYEKRPADRKTSEYMKEIRAKRTNYPKSGDKE